MSGPTDDNVCYDVGKWPRFLYDTEREFNNGLAQAEAKGQTPGWANFVLERFSKFHNPRLPKLDPQAEGHDVVKRLHEQCEAMPEPKALEARCQGDEVLSGMAAATVCNTLAAKMAETMNKQHKDPVKHRRRVEGLKQLADANPKSQRLKDRLREAEAKLQEALDEQAQAAQGMDPVAVRAAIREGVEEAEKEIERFQDTLNAFSYGTEPGTPVRYDAEHARGLAKRLANPKLQKIAELAGRLRRDAAKRQKAKTDKVTSEISNIELGADLSRVLPSELANLADPSTELDFYRRYVDRRLLQYKLTGKEAKSKGPIIFLADESGSQSGEPDIRTKATALAMLEVAQRQKRVWCYVHFASRVGQVHIAMPGQVSTDMIVDCMSTFMNGGTSFQEPLDKAVDLIKTHGALKDADVILITDGYCSTDHGWDESFRKVKAELEFNVYTVLVNVGGRECVEKWSDSVYTFDELLSDKFKDEVYSI